MSAVSGIFNLSASKPKQPQSISIPLIITDKIATVKNIFKHARIKELVLCNMPSIIKRPSINSSHGRYKAVNGIIISGNNLNSLSVKINLTESEIFARPAMIKIPPIIILNMKDIISAT